LLTVVFDLTVALEVGLVLACVLFVRRMGSLFEVRPEPGGPGELAFSLHGALFFGAAAKLDPVLRDLQAQAGPVRLRLDLGQLQALDRSGLEVLEQLQHLTQSKGGQMQLVGLHGEAQVVMQRAGFLDRLRTTETANAKQGATGPLA
jgi:SulP family sulfate permease